jgi:hypothetical protein
MKAALAEVGFAPEQICELTPQEAWDVLRAVGWTPTAKNDGTKEPTPSQAPSQEDKRKADLRARMSALVSKCEEGDVLALFLEDTDRRMQRRLDRMMGTTKAPWPARLRYATQFPRLDEGGLEMMLLWASEVEKPRLIIIDIWERFRPLDRGRSDNRYVSDYSNLARLQKAMSVFPGLAVVATNHLRKMGADEGAKILEIRGRDVTDHAIVVEQDATSLRWKSMGSAATGAATPERNRIIEVMKERGVMSVKQIAAAAGRDYDAVKHLLRSMLNDDAVEQGAHRGMYRLPVSPTSENGGGK